MERHLFLDISMGFFLSAVDMCWFLLLAYICITVEISIIKRGACKIVYYPILPSHICVPVPVKDLDLHHFMLWSFLHSMISGERYNVIVCFVDIGGIVHHHYLSFLSIIGILEIWE